MKILPVARKSIKVFAAVSVLALSALFMMPGTGQATLIDTLSYVEPTGTLGPNDSVTVWLKFTLESGSDSLYTDSNGTITSHSDLNGLDLIGGSLTSTVSGFPNPPYGGVFGPGPGPVQDYDSFFNQFHSLSLNAGDSFTYAIMTYFPNIGPVPPGTYTSGLDALSVWGPDTYIDYSDPDYPNGIERSNLHYIASTSGFTRTVEDAAPVPEPGTIALLGLGMAGLAIYGKRRQKKA